MDHRLLRPFPPTWNFSPMPPHYLYVYLHVTGYICLSQPNLKNQIPSLGAALPGRTWSVKARGDIDTIKPSPAITGNVLSGRAGSQQSLQDALKKRDTQIWAGDLRPVAPSCPTIFPTLQHSPVCSPKAEDQLPSFSRKSPLSSHPPPESHKPPRGFLDIRKPDRPRKPMVQESFASLD